MRQTRRLGIGGCTALALTLFGAGVTSAAKVKPVKVTINQITADGVGDAIGSITIKETKTGVDLAVDLSKLTPGEHGFHVHEHGMCDPADKEGKKTAGQSAGGHWDPAATKAHKGPGGGGHRGDLPKLVVPESGKVKTKLSVEGLTLADLSGKALMIHLNGDNYSDTPKPLGGGGDRVACGVIPGGAPMPPAAMAPTTPAAAKPAPAEPMKAPAAPAKTP